MFGVKGVGSIINVMIVGLLLCVGLIILRWDYSLKYVCM